MKNFDAAKHPRKKHQGAVGKGDNGGHFATTERNEIFVDDTSDHIAPVNALGEPLPDEIALDADTRRRFLLSGDIYQRLLALAYPDCTTEDLTHLATFGDIYQRRDVLSHPNTPVHFAIDAYKNTDDKSDSVCLTAVGHPEFPEETLREHTIKMAPYWSLHGDGLNLMRQRGLDTTGVEKTENDKASQRRNKIHKTLQSPSSTDAEILAAALEVTKGVPGVDGGYTLSGLACHPHASAETAMRIFRETKDGSFHANLIAQNPNLKWGDVKEIIRTSDYSRNAEFIALNRSDVPRTFIDEKLADESVYMQAAAAASPSATDADWQKIVSQATVEDARIACIQQSRATADEIRKLAKTQSRNVVFHVVRNKNAPGDVLEQYVENSRIGRSDKEHALRNPNFPRETLKNYATNDKTEWYIRSEALEVLRADTKKHYRKL